MLCQTTKAPTDKLPIRILTNETENKITFKKNIDIISKS